MTMSRPSSPLIIIAMVCLFFPGQSSESSLDFGESDELTPTKKKPCMKKPSESTQGNIGKGKIILRTFPE